MLILVSGFEMGDMTQDALEALDRAESIILHTGRCALGEYLKAAGREFTTLDELYERADSFDEHIRLCLDCLENAQENSVFCVLDTSDKTAAAYLRLHPDTHVVGGGIYAGLELRAGETLMRISAQDIAYADIPAFTGVLAAEIDNRLLAGEVKLRLSEVFGDGAQAFVRLPEGRIISLPLENLDRLKSYDHRCACLVNPPADAEDAEFYDFESLKRLFLRKKHTECVPEAEETVAKHMISMVEYICAGEAHGEYTLSDITRLAAQIIKEGDTSYE
ncbi:MAG: hypothetical protein IKR85_09030 [Clostridia bacterium]|nr:hypothetical protein [Clostridia bacterium]